VTAHHYGAGGHGGKKEWDFTIPKQISLVKVEAFKGVHVDWIRFYFSDGRVYTPFQGPSGVAGTRNRVIEGENAVIKAVSTKDSLQRFN